MHLDSDILIQGRLQSRQCPSVGKGSVIRVRKEHATHLPHSHQENLTIILQESSPPSDQQYNVWIKWKEKITVSSKSVSFPYIIWGTQPSPTKNTTQPSSLLNVLFNHHFNSYLIDVLVRFSASIYLGLNSMKQLSTNNRSTSHTVQHVRGKDFGEYAEMPQHLHLLFDCMSLGTGLFQC